MKKFTKWTDESILVKFSELHKGRYTYPDFEYINTAQTFTVRCNIHGDFQQKVRKHLEGQGCKRCNIHKEVKWKNSTGYYDENGKQVQLRLYTIWRGIQQRCKESYWDKHPHYKGTTCSDNFKSWDYFYEWCQEQTGVTSCDELGKPYELDKDLLGKGGQKVYAEDVCVFLPRAINNALCNNKGKIPSLVSKYKNSISEKALLALQLIK